MDGLADGLMVLKDAERRIVNRWDLAKRRVFSVAQI